MKTIKFKLDEEPLVGCDHVCVVVETSLNGEQIEDYLQAFKSFLFACGFTEDTISTIQTEEQFYLNTRKDLTNTE
jgi:hypothetical protein